MGQVTGPVNSLITDSLIITGADPYCKVTCGGSTVGTSIRKDTLDPAFDTQLVFYVKNPEDATVKVQVSIMYSVISFTKMIWDELCK